MSLSSWLLCSREQWNKMRFQIITQTEDDKFDTVTREFLHACRLLCVQPVFSLCAHPTATIFHMPLSLLRMHQLQLTSSSGPFVAERH